MQEVQQYREAQELAGIRKALDGEKFIARLTETAVRGLEAKHVANTALNVIRTSDKLQRCAPASIMGALCQAASVGLIPGDGLQQAYLIPRGGQCVYQIGAQGWRELAMRSGEVSSISSRCVYEGDDFEFSWGISPTITHKPGPLHGVEGNQISYAYAVAIMKDGVPVVEVMPRAEIDRIRAMSQTGRRSDSPWNKHYGEMARKTVVIRLCKSLPRSKEMGRALQIEEQEYIDTTAAPITPPSEGGEETTPAAPTFSEGSPQLPPPPPPASSLAMGSFLTHGSP